MSLGRRYGWDVCGMCKISIIQIIRVSKYKIVPKIYLPCSKVRQMEIALFCIYIVGSILVRALFLIQPKLVVVYDIL